MEGLQQLGRDGISMTSPTSPSRFAATRWTLVLRAGGDSSQARAALSELCEIYYEPVVAFIRYWKNGTSSEDAREQAHAFFESLLSKQSMGQPDPRRGRFRNYLAGAIKHFLLEKRRAQATEKRGGDAPHEELDDSLPSHESPDDTHFDRAWALAVLARALQALEEELTKAGKGETFQVLKPWLDGNASSPQSEAAKALGLSETAVKVAIHRLRQRFRELIRTEVAATLHDPTELEAELRHLVEALAK